MPVVKFMKIHPSAKIPTKGTAGSACYDIYAVERVALNHHVSTVRTGLKMEIPSGYMVEVRPRSGLAKMGVILPNAPCTIDSDYRGELLVLMMSLQGECILAAGARIAQMRLVKLVDTVFVVTEKLSETIRGEGAFGSTGS